MNLKEWLSGVFQYGVWIEVESEYAIARARFGNSIVGIYSNNCGVIFV